MALALVKEGYGVELWVPQHNSLNDKNDWPFAVHTIANQGTLDWPCRLKTAQAMNAMRETVEQSILYLPEPGPILTMMYALLLNLPKPKKLILTLHGSEILRFSKWPHRHALFARLLECASSIGVVSEFNRRLLLQHHPSVSEKIKTVSGALRSTFTPLPHTLNDSKAMKLITVGRIHPRKGQIYVIEALAQLPLELGSQVTYQIAGPTVNKQYFERLEQASKAHEINVEFLGEVTDEDLTVYYQNADAFVMTSIQKGVSIEGFGLVYIEAASCGLPVVAHDTGGVSEAVIDGETGLLIKPGDIDALANAIHRMLTTPSLRHTLGEAGKERVKRLSWEANTQALFT